MLRVDSIKNFKDHNALIEDLVYMHDEQVNKFTSILVKERLTPEDIEALIFAGRVFLDINLVLFREVRRIDELVKDNNLQTKYKDL